MGRQEAHIGLRESLQTIGEDRHLTEDVEGSNELQGEGNTYDEIVLHACIK